MKQVYLLGKLLWSDAETMVWLATTAILGLTPTWSSKSSGLDAITSASIMRPSRRQALAAAAGLSTIPSASFAAAKPSEAERVLQNVEWEEVPFWTKGDFRRLDESDDALFYDQPKLVLHIDDPAVKAATQYYGRLFDEVSSRKYGERDHELDVLDLCSSWVSHYPSGRRLGRVAGLGMNAVELDKNPILTESVVRDLNKEPTLPYKDASFDVITCTVSIDYLTSPLKVMAEAARVLRPGGVVALTISNRIFFSKAIALWTGKDDEEHIYTVGGYLHYGGSGLLAEPGVEDLRPLPRGKTDPLYAIFARRL